MARPTPTTTPGRKTPGRVPTGRRIVETVKRTIDEFDMLAPGSAVLVGVSGGPDSVALLHILHHLAPGNNWRLAVAHVNHALRKEAEAEAEFVARLSSRLGMACHLKKADVYRLHKKRRVSLEEAARQARYDFFQAVAARHRFDKIALGHTADDNAELVLMFVIRGAGPVGISGIPPVRSRRIVRPLIRLARRDILDYVKAFDLAYVIDRSNQDDRFMRNRIRNKLLPYLRRSYNPRVSEALNRLSDIGREEEAWIDAAAAAHYNAARAVDAAGRLHLSIARFTRHPKAVQRRIVRQAIGEIKGDLRRIAFRHVTAAIDLLNSPRPVSRLDLPDGLVLERKGTAATLTKRTRPQRPRRAADPEDVPLPYCRQVSRPDQGMLAVTLSEIDCRVTFEALAVENVETIRQAGQQVAFFDMNSLDFPLTLRPVRAGDRFRPLGLKGSQKIKKYFIDHKVPRRRRWSCPVLVSRGRVIWLAGHRTAEECRVTPVTRVLLRAEITCLGGDRD